MTKTMPATEIEPLVLRLGPLLKKMSDHEFYEFCRLNEEWQIEMSSDGELIIMAPTGAEGGRRNFKLTTFFGNWVEADGTGIGFDSSTMFTLPNGAKRSPDAAWIRKSRWDQLTADEKEEFSPICPDFVIELRSRTDRLKRLQVKMEEYIANGAQLGWLIDPLEKKVYVYRPGAAVEILDNPETVSGEPLLAGFNLPVAELWS
ncbi:MAG: Uma2 family endonuclease [Blastocatellia bacterium]